MTTLEKSKRINKRLQGKIIAIFSMEAFIYVWFFLWLVLEVSVRYANLSGVTYILPEYWEGASLNQISGILLTDKKYKLGCGLRVGMDENEIAELKLSLERYVKDEKGTGLEQKSGGGIPLYRGMDNAEIIDFDYAYSCDDGFVLNEKDQKEMIEELNLPEECYSETHFILIAFVKNEKVSGIFMGKIP